jgi:hypothetical protein
VKLPPSSPNLNARFVRSIKESCLERLILFGEASLRKATHEFVEHYHRERNHQGLGNRLIIEEASCSGSHGGIQRRQRLGGMLNYYYRQAPDRAGSNFDGMVALRVSAPIVVPPTAVARFLAASRSMQSGVDRVELPGYEPTIH